MPKPLPAHVQITNLVHRYAELVDGGDFAGLGELFADGALITESGTLRGAEAVRGNFTRWVRIYPDNGTPHTRHVTTNLVLEIDEDTGSAAARSYATVFQYGPGNRLEPIFSVRYFDDFRCVDGTWQFARRRYVDPAAGDTTGHLLRDFDN